MYECGKLKKVIGNKFLFPVILEQCDIDVPLEYFKYEYFDSRNGELNMKKD